MTNLYMTKSIFVNETNVSRNDVLLIETYQL